MADPSAARMIAAACDLRYGGCDDRILWLAVVIVAGALALGAWWFRRNR
jgi:hypothetical protein